MSQFSIPDLPGVSFTEDDILNDEELQNELNSLGITDSRGKSAASKQPKKIQNRQKTLEEELEGLNENDLINFDNNEVISNDLFDNHVQKAAAIEINYDQQITSCNSIDTAKQNALECQRSGDTTTALKWFRKMNELKVIAGNEAIHRMKTNNSNNNKVATNASLQSQSSNNQLKQPISTTNSNNNNISANNQINIENAFNHLEELLQTAEQFNLNEAKKLRTINSKLAVEKMKLYKYYNQELSILKSRRLMNGCILPLYHFETKQIEEIIENKDIGDNELNIIIKSINNINNNYINKNITLKIYINYTSNSDESLITDLITTIKIHKTNNTEINYNKIYNNIIKRNKTNSITFGRKKIKFELIYNTFFTKTIIGCAIITFNELLTKCSTGGELILTEDDKLRSKKIGGTINILLKIRNPINNNIFEKNIIEERILIIDKWMDPIVSVPVSVVSSVITVNETVSNDLSLQNKIEVTKVIENQIETNNNNNNNNSNEIIMNSNSNNNNNETSNTNTIVLTKREKEDPTAIEFLESNDVIEYEIQLTNNQIKQLKDKKISENENNYFLLTIKLQGLQFKLNQLQNKVANEELSLIEYIKIIKQRLLRDYEILNYIKLNNSNELIIEINSIQVSFIECYVMLRYVMLCYVMLFPFILFLLCHLFV